MTANFITGLFTLGGVLLTGALALVGYKFRIKHELEKELLANHFEHRLKTYKKLCEFVSSVYQSGSPESGINDVREINRNLYLIGSPDVVRAFNRIFDTSSEKLRTKGMSSDEVKKIQTTVYKDILIAVRMDLYPHQEKLDHKDIRVLEPKKLPSTN